MDNLVVNHCSERNFFNKVILGDFQLIDAQTPTQYSTRHIIGAQNINLNSQSLAQDFAALQRKCYAERKDQILIYTNKFVDSQNELQILIDVIASTKVNIVSILTADFEKFVQHYPFLITESKKPAPKEDEDSMLSDDEDEDTFESSDHVYPCHVHDHIFLGSEFIAGQLPVLQHLKITHILNITHECKNYFEQSTEYKVTYHRFKIHDKESEDLLSGLKECLQFIDTAVSNNGKVLVHCAQGRSRSPSVVIAYLMYKHHMSYQQAYDIVRESRDYLHINDGFVRQLKGLESELK